MTTKAKTMFTIVGNCSPSFRYVCAAVLDYSLHFFVENSRESYRICLVFVPGRVADGVEDDRFSYVPGWLIMETSYFKRLFAERWRENRTRGWHFSRGGSEERTAQSWVSMPSRHGDIYACKFSWTEWYSVISGTGRSLRPCWKSSLQAERMSPMLWCSV